MDPITLMAIAGGVGALQSGVASLSGRKAAKENRAAAEKLQQKLSTNDFGLTEAQKASARREMLDPLKSGLTAQRSAAEAAMATRGGSVSGADLARLRFEQQRGLAQGSEQATNRIVAADLDAARFQREKARQELAARQSADAQRKAQIASTIISALGGVAKAGAMTAAAGRITGDAETDPAAYSSDADILSGFGAVA